MRPRALCAVAMDGEGAERVRVRVRVKVRLRRRLIHIVKVIGVPLTRWPHFLVHSCILALCRSRTDRQTSKETDDLYAIQ